MKITIEDITAAHQRIAPHIHHTPVLTNKAINEMAGCDIHFKCENFQKIGAFKIRGAMNTALALPAQALRNGLATHSSGNHAQAVAYTARQLGVKAFIVMPRTSPKVKVDAVNGYGADITFCEPNQQAREEALAQIIETTGAEFIHPYDNYGVITGQATCAKEFIEDAGPFDCMMAPVSGGGLLSGTCLSTHYLLPKAIVYGGEPEGAADAILSIKSGKIEKAPFVNTIADGLQTTLCEKTLTILKEHVKEILLVSEEEIKSTLRLVLERMKIVIEPSSAVPLAALLRNKEKFKGKKVGIIFSGGNVDITKFNEWF
jgi:threonine dehydratase